MALTITGGAPLATNRNNTTIDTVAATFTPASGDKKIIAICWSEFDYNVAISGLADNQSGTWVELLTTASAQTYYGSLWIFERTAGTVGSSTTVTATWASNIYIPSITVIEVSSDVGAITTGAALDEGTMVLASGAPAVDCSARTSGRGLLAAVAGRASTANTFNAPGNSWSEILDSTGSFSDIVGVQFHATGHDTATFTLNTGTMDAAVGAIELIEEAGGGGTEIAAAADGVATTAVSLAVIRNSMVAATAGIGASTATLYKVTAVDMGTVAGAATTSAAMLKLRQLSVATAADGAATTTVSMAAVRALAAATDGVATTTANISTSAEIQLATSASGAGVASVGMYAVRAIAAAAAGSATTAVAAGVVRSLAAASDGLGTVTLALTNNEDTTLEVAASADGTASTSSSMNVVRALTVTSAGTGAVTLTLTNNAGTVAVSGAYADEHARAYQMVLRAGG